MREAVIAVLIALPIALAILFGLGCWAIGVIERLLPFWLRPFLGPPWGGE
jgi:hypothetical protein